MKERKYRFRKILITIVVPLFIVFVNYLRSPTGYLKIFVLDVGQGDAILIQTEDRNYGLIDTGPDGSLLFELDKILPPWQKSLDFVLITHPDQDHIGGLPFVMEIYEVNELFLNEVENNNKAYKYIVDNLGSSRAQRISLSASQNFRLGCCTQFDVLWPRVNSSSLSVNDSSIALVLCYKDFFMYLGGDLSSRYEETILSDDDYDLDVIKVGHHGSKTSTSDSFIKLGNPEIAVISVGKNNYGHPDNLVLSALDENGLQTYRTDLSGTIMISVDIHGGFVAGGIR